LASVDLTARALDPQELAGAVGDLVVPCGGLARAHRGLGLPQTALNQAKIGGQPPAVREIADPCRHRPAPQPTIPSSSSNSWSVIAISRAATL
jgi:hypothetical protein